MIQTNLNGCKIPKELLGCDNTNCENIKIIPKTEQVRMKNEFDSGLVNWCKQCIERDKDFITKCDNCNSTNREIYLIEIYQPFDNHSEFKGYLCEYCTDDISYCESCDRYIYDSNGYRQNLRYNEESGSMVCVSCLQKQWFDEGMKEFSEGDWFTDSNLYSNGFVKHSSYFCQSKESYENAKNVFICLRVENLVIVSIEASGMGLEHHIALWTKKLDLLDINDRFEPCETEGEGSEVVYL